MSPSPKSEHAIHITDVVAKLHEEKYIDFAIDTYIQFYYITFYSKYQVVSLCCLQKKEVQICNRHDMHVLVGAY